MLSEYIKENYEPGEPIFLQDIKIDGMSDANIRQKIKKLTEEGEVIRYEQGINIFPEWGALWGTMQDIHWQIKWESQCRYL